MKFKIWSVFFTGVFLFTTIFLGSLQAKDINIQFRTMEHGKAASVEQEIVDMFGKSRPDIKVDLLQGQWTQYYSQLRLAVMGGNPPQLGVTLLQKIVEIDEYLTALDESPVGNLLEMAGINPAEFDQKGWKAGQLNGKQYAIPFNYPALLMWYNKEIFSKAGLDPEKFPDTMEEFVDACNKIKAAGFYAFHPASDGPPRFWRRTWYMLFWEQGGELFDEGYTKATFNNEQGIKALQFLVDIIHKYGWNVVGADGYKQFSGKELGIIYAGNWFYPYAAKLGDNWSGAKVPKFFDKRVTWLNGHGFQIPKQPEGTPKEVYMAAMDLIKFYLKNLPKSTMVAGHIPAYKPALADKTLIESDYYTKAGKYIAAMVEAGELHYPIQNAKGSELENAIQINIELAVNGKISPEEALANAEKECNSILSKK